MVQMKKNVAVSAAVQKKSVKAMPPVPANLHVVKISSLPFGFFEEALLDYFKQFGRVVRVRVARSKTSGNHKGWAYVGFDDDDVAEVAAETMNGYLMYEHRLRCKVMSRDEIPRCMRRGATLALRPKRNGGAIKQAKSMNKTRTGKQLDAASKRRTANLQKRMAALKTMGIDYSLGPLANVTVDPSEVVDVTPAMTKKDTPKQAKTPQPKRAAEAAAPANKASMAPVPQHTPRQSKPSQSDETPSKKAKLASPKNTTPKNTTPKPVTPRLEALRTPATGKKGKTPSKSKTPTRNTPPVLRNRGKKLDIQ